MIASKSDRYRELAEQLTALLAGESDPIANAANMAGFYFRRGAQLVLGPFQGKPACVRITIGRGVCGTAAARAATVLVSDVHDFPGHIACDPNSIVPAAIENPSRFVARINIRAQLIPPPPCRTAGGVHQPRLEPGAVSRNDLGGRLGMDHGRIE